MLDNKISELDIIEKDILSSLKDVKELIVAKVTAQFKELGKAVEYNVRQRRHQLKTRRHQLDGHHLQSDNALAFM